MYKKTKNHIEDTLKFILVYSYFTDKKNGEIALNQLAIATFLDLKRLAITRQFKTIKDMGFIKVTKKARFNTKWYSNLYYIDQEAINEYLIEKTGHDVINNISSEQDVYFNFLALAKKIHEEKVIEGLTEEEMTVYLEKVKKKRDREQEKIDRLKEQNWYYLKLLVLVNNPFFPMKYLNENRKRLTNTLCITKNPENPGHENDTVRMNMLREFFNSDKIVEFDTNASIYRLSYALGNNQLASHMNDMYELIYKECNFNHSWSKKMRQQFKKLLMPIYMLEQTIGFKCMEFAKHSRWTYFLNSEVEKQYNFYKYFVDTLNLDLKTILTTVRDAMHKVFNLDKFYQADIFIHESNLHIIMLNIFKDRGIKTINVYDGFYCEEGTMTQELYDEIYDEATNILLDNLSNGVA